MDSNLWTHQWHKQWHAYIISVRTHEAVYRTYQERWMMRTDAKGESGNSVQKTRLDDEGMCAYILSKWIECSPMTCETEVQSRVESYNRLKKWYRLSIKRYGCHLSIIRYGYRLSIIRYGSKLNWSNPRNEVVPSPTPWCSTKWKGSFQVAFDYGRQLYLYIYIYIYIWFVCYLMAYLPSRVI